MTDCRACKSSNCALAAQAEGFWEKRVLARLRLYPFQCQSCGKRFYAFRRDEPMIVPALKSFPAALPAADEQGFREAVDQIRTSEGRLQGGRPSNGRQPTGIDGPSAPRFQSGSSYSSQPAVLAGRKPSRNGPAGLKQRRVDMQRELADAVLKLIQYQCIRIEVTSRPDAQSDSRQPAATSAGPQPDRAPTSDDAPPPVDASKQSPPGSKEDPGGREVSKRIFTLRPGRL